jgi:hypothetical protein
MDATGEAARAAERSSHQLRAQQGHPACDVSRSDGCQEGSGLGDAGRRSRSQGAHEERLRNGIDDGRESRLGSGRAHPGIHALPCGNQNRERDKEFGGSQHPEPVTHASLIVTQGQGQQPGSKRAKRGLPEVVDERRRNKPEGRGRGPMYRCDHGFSAFLESFFKARSASLTSSRESLPDSIRCAITGWVFPPK